MLVGNGGMIEDIEPVRVDFLDFLHAVQEGIVVYLPIIQVIEQSLITNGSRFEPVCETFLCNLLGHIDTRLGVHEVQLVVARSLGNGDCSGIIDSRRTFLTAFGSHDDDAVGCPYTVDRGGGSILQHVNLLDIHRVKAGNGITDKVHIVQVIERLGGDGDRVVQNHAVDNPERFTVSGNGGSTTDTDLGSGTWGG